MRYSKFDFGDRPVVKRELVVHTGVKDGDLLQESKPYQTLEAWDGTNTRIIPYQQYRDKEVKKLETKYKVTDFQVELDREVADLTEENYKYTMQHILKLEEKARLEKLARFCMETEMEVKQMITIYSATGSPYLFAQDGQLFGQIDITQSVFDDSDASQIALTSVQFILIKFNSKSSTAYEAQIVMGDADGRTKDTIYVRLTANCAKEMRLASEMKIKVQIQFRLNRLHFCNMRWAVDNLISTSVLFPTKNEHPALICPQAPDSEIKLNRLQVGAVRFLREKGGFNSKTPLLLLYGPFGTGKTYTLANGVMSALTDTDTRILICTHTNSAADLYITEYLDSFVRTWSTCQFAMDMLRVYATDRDVRTIPEVVQQYMIFDNGYIKRLDEWDIRGKRIVVTTTSSAIQLASFPRLRGYFTHIVIDEAAQALETEAIIPLILAIPSTCVVLAGDHVQMGPKVYSKRGRDMKFHHSLLERLFEHCLRNKCHRQILLRNNYRTHEIILAFLSKVFYSAEDLEACGNQPRHPVYYPLEFRAVKGYDMMIGYSYVNSYEVLETANRVQELLENWPEEIWGPKSQEEIGVLTPYRLQVQQLRREFRMRKLQRVFVDRLQGVQGKQFRVVIISTVRTQKTINNKDADPETQYYLGFLSDMRQLNTAFTRAQSLVVVVGNPIALCAIGECCTVWKKYVKECERNQSLYPQGTAYKDIRLDISTATTTLNPNAVSFTPHTYESSSDPHDFRSDVSSHSPQTIQNTVTNQGLSDDESEDIDFNTDDVILQELRRQIRKDRRRKEGEEDDTSEDETEDETEDEDQMVSPRKIRMIEEDDHVRVVVEEEDDDDNIKPRKELQTGKTLTCTFRMDIDGRRYAVPKESADEMTEIHIGNHTQRGTAMDGDEVLVEILANEDSEETNMQTEDDQNKVYGKVLNVEKRAVDFTNKKLVCLADPYSDNLMVPVNRRLPKIMILFPTGRSTKGKRSPGHLVVPVCQLSKTRAIRKRDVVVSNKDRPHKLFKVQWLKWKKNCHYPLGVVIGDLPPGDNREDGLKILKQIYEVRNQEVSNDFLEQFPSEWSIPDEEYRKRMDLRHLLVFTIDPPDAKDLDDALSVQKIQDGRYMVGVHIADVSHFVRCGTDTDAKAKGMATSFYPAFDDPIHMLPLRLSIDLCSLKPGKDRLTISVFLIFEEDGKLIETKIARSAVRSRIQLTYDDAESVIVDDNGVCDNELKQCISILGSLAWRCRQSRLGKARFSHDGSLDSITHPRAHTLVEEMMLLANQTVAGFLITKLPQCTPLRRQLPPLKEHFRAWKEEYSVGIKQSAHLSYRKEILQHILKDKQIYGDDDNDHSNEMRIMHNTWQKIKLCAEESQLDSCHLAGLICTDQYHPQLAPIHSALHCILQSGEYINSGEHAHEAQIHSSLFMTTYTHFTSPIRRYIDIIVHRLLVAILNKEMSLPHDDKEVTEICHNCNIRCFAAREFELKTHALNLAIELKQRPMHIHGVTERLTEKNLQIGFKHDDRVSKAVKKSSVGFNLLKPIVKPEFEEGDNTAVMRWKERVYHMRGMPKLSPHDILANQSKRASLQVRNNHRYAVEIPTNRWQCINRAIACENWIGVRRQVLQAARDVKASMVSLDTTKNSSETEELSGNVIVQDVTCETDDDDKKKKHYLQFEHNFQVGDVNEVQLYPTFNRGLLSPNVQLFQMTPTLDFCMEHRGKPVQCLSSIADHTPDRKDINTYKKTWLPIIDMLAAYNAVQENETVVLQGVQIEWQQHSTEALPTGSFTLCKKFCNDRHIKISQVKVSGRKVAYLCIRYSGQCAALNIPSEVGVSASIGKEHQAMTFVAHACTWDVKETLDKQDWDKSTLTIFFEVNQMSAPFPRILRSSGRQPKECTVEIIPVCYPDSRLEGAVTEVDSPSASSLVRNICLLKPIDKAEYEDDNDALDMKILVSEAKKGRTFIVRGCDLNRLNRTQIEAVTNALSQRFTVIQGPPGTGKTVTGAYLVYFFTEQNKHLPNRGKGRPQILYCGPSNKSVDVIAEYLKNFRIPIVRVYSKGIESREFPIPGLPSMTGKMDSKDVIMDPRHKKISLHHLIRMRRRSDGMKPNSNCEAILAYDRRFRTPDYEPDHREIKEYHKLIFLAEIEELKKYQVILTTCNAAGSNRIIEGTNIIQCIVDEAGMCNEPETLIPLVSTKPLQIVLIGDHKQLRPIIQEPTARLLGMEISLLQKYAKQMKMLTVQYRMHEAICYFPSTTFYDGKLITPYTVKQRQPNPLHRIWPGNGSRPIVFCHCTGPEETLSVRTAEGNEMSKANQYEVDQAVRMAKVLVDRYDISAKDIVVLSQYRLQCDKISKGLEACGKSDINVRTVIQSQGSEWNFVIFSTVRSLPRVEIEENPNFGWRKKFLGFITDENQMNVALTRAKLGLILVGNKYLLQTHKRWKELLDHYKENNCVVDACRFLRVRNQWH